MDSDSHSGGSRQVRAQFINVVPGQALAFTVGYARGGKLLHPGTGVWTFAPDPQPLTVGTNIAFGQGSCDPNRTTVEVLFRPGASPATFTAFFYTWNADGTLLTITTEDNSAAAELAIDIIIHEAERSGATGAS